MIASAAPPLTSGWLAVAPARREFLIYKGYTVASFVFLVGSMVFQYYRYFPPELGLRDFGPIAGVAASKLLAILMAGLCLWLGKPNLLRRVCYWYAALVVWNICIILVSPPQTFIAGARPF